MNVSPLRSQISDVGIVWVFLWPSWHDKKKLKCFLGFANRSRATDVQIVVLLPQLTLFGQDNDVLPHLKRGRK